MIHQLSSRQLEIVSGSLLGDGWLQRAPGCPTANWSFRKKQSKHPLGGQDRTEYLSWHYNELCPLSQNMDEGKNRLLIKNAVTEQLEFSTEERIQVTFRTCADQQFTALARTWYLHDDGKVVLKNRRVIKIVPKSLRLTPLALAVWYCDDGCNSPTRRRVEIATQSFQHEELEFLVKKLQIDLGITAYVTGKMIGISTDDYTKFIGTVRPYVEKWTCFHYKIDLSSYVPPKPRFGEKHHNARFSGADIAEMFKLDKEGVLRKLIAAKFNTNPGVVSNILNGKRRIMG